MLMFTKRNIKGKILTAWQENLIIEVIPISESMNSEIRTTSSLLCKIIKD